MVIGGSNGAVEAALDLWRAGAWVTLVHRGAVLRPAVKYGLRPDFEDRVRGGFDRGVLFHAGAGFRAGMGAGGGAAGEEAPQGRRRSRRTWRSSSSVTTRCCAPRGVRYEGGRPQLSETFETSVPGHYALRERGVRRGHPQRLY